MNRCAKNSGRSLAFSDITAKKNNRESKHPRPGAGGGGG